jgi:hypothetical protein
MADTEPATNPITAAPPSDAGASRHSSLGSRRRDLLAAAVLALLVLAGSPFLRVYHRITVMDVSVVRIEPDGRRIPIPTPSSLWNPGVRVLAAQRSPGAAVRAADLRIRQVMRSDPAIAAAPPGTRFEWLIRYSENSAGLDRSALYVYPAPAEAPR